MPWRQNYDPFSSQFLSTAVAALPVAALLGFLAWGRVRAWVAALIGLGTALAVAIFAFRMPVGAAVGSAVFGGAYGLFPIGWIVLNVMFLHTLTLQSGCLEALKQNLTRMMPDPRLQLILVAFCFGGFIEGSAGFGAPVAITAAMLFSLGFSPLHAAGLSLIANTAPVAFGSVGIPIVTLAQMTGLDENKLSAMAGRQLPPFSLLIPAWIVLAYGGRKALAGVWPGALVAGGSFAIMQFAVSNLFGPSLVDMAAGASSIASFFIWARFWGPKPDATEKLDNAMSQTAIPPSLGPGIKPSNPWMPWIILTVFLFAWGLPVVKRAMDEAPTPKWAIPLLHEKVVRSAPVAVAASPDRPVSPEKAEFRLNWLSATGTGILASAIVVGFLLGYSPIELIRAYARTLFRVRISLLTIAAMLALGNVTKYSGTDATLGLALAGTGVFYPFFGTLLGWLGVALTGSDTASNVLFGSLQKITSQQLGLSPYLMCAANSTGGVMGKMIDAQSIVVAGTAIQCHGQEGKILRFVFLHSITLAAGVGVWVWILAKVAIFEGWVVR